MDTASRLEFGYNPLYVEDGLLHCGLAKHRMNTRFDQ
jgi:hypothetical protein